MWGKRMWSRLHLICLALTVTQTVAYLWYLSYHPILTRWKDSIRVEQETKTMLALLSSSNKGKFPHLFAPLNEFIVINFIFEAGKEKRRTQSCRS